MSEPPTTGPNPYQPPAPEQQTALTRCQACQVPAATRFVTLRQNIGALVMRFPRSVQGAMCRDCIGRYFWRYTLTTLFLGWWGVISFFCTLAWIPTNIVTFISSRSLPRPQREQVR
jgi:hypothetical protein